MKLSWLPIHICIIIAVVSVGCSGNRPLKEPSLVNEAARFAGSYERNMRLGRYYLALSDAEKALSVNRILDRDNPIAVALNNLGTVQARLQMSEEAAASYNEAIGISRRTGAAKIHAVCLNNLAGMLVETDPARAESMALTAYEIGHDNSWKGVMARAVHIRARVALQNNDADRSAELCEEALAYAMDARESRVRAACLITLSRAKALVGDHGTALKLVEKALAIDRDLADPYAIAMDYSRLAEIQELAGDGKAARTSRHKAEEIFEILGVR